MLTHCIFNRVSNLRFPIPMTTGPHTWQMVFMFAGNMANWIDDDWQMIEHMVNLYHIQDKDHEGEWVAKVFVNTAAERGGLDKMSIIYLVIVN